MKKKSRSQEIAYLLRKFILLKGRTWRKLERLDGLELENRRLAKIANEREAEIEQLQRSLKEDGDRRFAEFKPLIKEIVEAATSKYQETIAALYVQIYTKPNRRGRKS